MNYQNTLLTTLSDMHSGGSTALFINRQWQDEYQNHTPTERQRRIYEVFEQCMEYAKAKRENKRLIVVHNGDAIEGLHHNSIQVAVMNKKSQAAIHTELMDTFLTAASFDRDRGDRLFYVRGTEVHVEDMENDIAADLGAEPKDPATGVFVYDHLELNVNGRKVWYVHHGKDRGKGANEGNTLRNWLRDIKYDCEKVGVEPPDLIFSGHTHTPGYNTFVYRKGDGFNVLHGVICPSWQEKTRYGYKVAPVERNEIGAVFVEVTAGGDIRIPRFILKQTDKVQAVQI